MEATPKTDNFLKAIKKYAAQQKKSINQEVKQLKEEKIKLAEDKARLDSERLIKDRLEAKRNEQTSVIAKKTQEGQKKLFLARSEMTEEIFALAEKKLTDFTQTDRYAPSLRRSAEQIAQLFDGKPCVLRVKEIDVDTAKMLLPLFGDGSKAEADSSVKIGGIKAYCTEMGIIADETLDTKLQNQREWFIENSGLSVL